MDPVGRFYEPFEAYTQVVKSLWFNNLVIYVVLAVVFAIITNGSRSYILRLTNDHELNQHSRRRHRRLSGLSYDVVHVGTSFYLYNTVSNRNISCALLSADCPHSIIYMKSLSKYR